MGENGRKSEANILTVHTFPCPDYTQGHVIVIHHIYSYTMWLKVQYQDHVADKPINGVLIAPPVCGY